MKPFFKTFISIIPLVSAIVLCTCCSDDDEGKIDSSILTVEIEQVDFSYKTIEVKITPAQHADRFSFGFSDNADDVKKFEDGTLPNIISIKGNEPLDRVYSDLFPSEDYYVFAQSAYKNYKGEIVTQKISTKDAGNIPPAEVKVELVKARWNALDIKFIPDDEVVKYWYAIGGAEDEESFKSGEMEGIVTVSSTADPLEKTFGQLAPDTEYIVFVQCENEVGKRYFYKKVVKTLDVSSVPGASVAISVTASGSSSINADLLPDTKTVSYRYAIGKAADEDDFKNAILGGIVNEQGNNKKSVSFKNLVPDTEYVIFVAVKNEAGVESFFKEAVSTTALPQISSVVIISSVDEEGVEISVTPAPGISKFQIFLVSETNYKTLVGAGVGVDKMCDSFINKGWAKEYTSAIEDTILKFKELSGSEDDYVVLVREFDMYGGSKTMVVSEGSTTPEKSIVVISDVTESGIKISVSPKGSVTKYYVGIIAKTNYDMLVGILGSEGQLYDKMLGNGWAKEYDRPLLDEELKFSDHNGSKENYVVMIREHYSDNTTAIFKYYGK